MRECNYCRRTDSLGYMPDRDGHTPGEGWVCTRCAKEQRDEVIELARDLYRVATFALTMIRRETGQPLSATEEELERLRRLPRRWSLSRENAWPELPESAENDE